MALFVPLPTFGGSRFLAVVSFCMNTGLPLMCRFPLECTLPHTVSPVIQKTFPSKLVIHAKRVKLFFRWVLK